MATYNGTNGNDNVTVGFNALYGADGNDLLSANAIGYNVIEGGRGLDFLFFNSTNVNTYGSIYGGDDNDTIFGFQNGDSLYGGEGNDVIYGGYSNGSHPIYYYILSDVSGNDYIDGGNGIDALYGLDGNDVIYGGDGNDMGIITTPNANYYLDSTSLGTAQAGLFGGAGNDYLDGGRGNDFLDGGTGDDTLYGGTGADVLDGGAGFDFASYSNAASGIVARLDFAAGLFGEANGDSYTFSDGLLTVEGIIGSNFADTIIGDGAANGIYGGGGNDVILGLGGSDGIFGDFGNDTLFGGRGTDYLVGGNGAPVPAGQTDNDVFAFVSADTETGVYDTIIDFHDGEDAILLQGFGYTNASQPILIDVAYGPNLSATVISYGGGTAGVTVVGVTSAQLQGAPAAGGDWVLY